MRIIEEKEWAKRRITQHKRFPLIKSGAYGTHPCLRASTHRQANFCFAKTSFMLGTLYEIQKSAQKHLYK